MRGDLAEFGTYEGFTLTMLSHNLYVYGLTNRKIWAFDSFEGLPEPTADDKRSEGVVWKKGAYRRDERWLLRALKRRGVKQRIVTVSGWYDESLQGDLAQSAMLFSFVYVDCDLYSSTVPVLDYLSDRLEDGAILAFDDWYTHKGRETEGEARAFWEWLERNPAITAMRYLPIGWHGQSFIIHREDADSDKILNSGQ